MTTRLVYREHHKNKHGEWYLAHQYPTPEDIPENVRWAYVHMLEHGNEYIKIGETMFDITTEMIL